MIKSSLIRKGKLAILGLKKLGMAGSKGGILRNSSTQILGRVLILNIVGLAMGQNAVTIVGPTTPVTPGSTVKIDLQLNATDQISALQWNLVPITSIIPTTTLTNKTLKCGAKTCIVYPNLTSTNPNGPIANGVFASYNYVVPTTATGPIVFSFSSLVAASPLGDALGTVTPPPFSLQIKTAFPISDIDGDGLVTATDLGLITSQVLGDTCANDQNGDGVCNIVDIVLVYIHIGK